MKKGKKRLAPNPKALEKKAWNKYREYIIKRDGGKCVICGSTEILQVGHVIPQGQGKCIKFFEPDCFLQCSRCNTKHFYECQNAWDKSPVYFLWFEEKHPGMLDRIKLKKKEIGIHLSWGDTINKKDWVYIHDFYQSKLDDLVESEH